MPITYAPLATVRLEINPSASNTAEDEYGLDAAQFVTRRIDEVKKLSFAPYKHPYVYDVPEYILVGDRTVMLTQRPLLEVTSVTLPDASTLVLNTDYVLWPRGETPYRGLLLADTVDTTDFEPTAALNASLTILGIWGWRSEYAYAWVNTTTITTDSGATLAVTSSANLSPGMLIRAGTEYLCIETVVNATSITVTRAIRGTTQALQTGVALYVFNAEPSIVRVTQRWAAYLHSRRGTFSTVSYDGVEQVQFPPDIPADAQRVLDNGEWSAVYERRGTGLDRVHA